MIRNLLWTLALVSGILIRDLRDQVSSSQDKTETEECRSQVMRPTPRPNIVSRNGTDTETEKS